MINFIKGQTHTGKSSYVFDTMKNNGAVSKQLLIVPELYSHAYERKLCMQNADVPYENLEVTSFTHIANMVFSEVGGLSDTYLSDGGRTLIMRRALISCNSTLKMYQGAFNKIDMIDALCNVVDELLCYNTDPSELLSSASLAEGTFADKIHDIAIIYGAYQALTDGELRDVRQKTVSLAEKINSCTIFNNADVYFDGFSGFTPIEYEVIRSIINKANSVTFTLTLDNNLPELLPNVQKTYEKLLKIVGNKPYAVIDLNENLVKTPLYNLAQIVMGNNSEVCTDTLPCDIYFASDIYDECYKACAKIIELTAKNGAKYHDIVVTARDFGQYREVFAMICHKYNIPIYISEKTDITSKPIINMILSALSAVTKSYSYDDMFSCLKTGLWNISDEDIYSLENYVLTWNIKGRKWFVPFTFHPNGYGKPFDEQSDELLAKLESIRISITDAFSLLDNSLKNADTAETMCRALYEFLCFIGTPEKIIEVSEYYENTNQLVLSEEYNSLWDIFITALEEICKIHGNATVDKSVFIDILKLVLSKYDIGTIPVSMDRVNVGNVNRVCHHAVPHLIILGVNDGKFPLANINDGLLTDDDRELLVGLGIELAEFGQDLFIAENGYIYDAFCCPSQSIYLSLSLNDGKSILKQSVIIDAIITHCTNINIQNFEQNTEKHALSSKKTALELAMTGCQNIYSDAQKSAYEHFKNSDQFKNLYAKANYKRGVISDVNVIRGLYGDKPRLTATRVDKFYSCRFAFFMEYGLGAKERTRGEFSAPEAGTFIHYVLENIVKLYQDSDDKESFSGTVLTDECKRITDAYIAEILGGFEDKSARFVFLIERLASIVCQIAENVILELKSSLFQPVDFELTFGMGRKLPQIEVPIDQNFTMELVGKVDRIDGYISDDILYLKVVDYKSGSKSFDLSDIWHGLSAQLLIYLFAAGQSGTNYFKHKLGENIRSVIPAGVLYVPTREIMLNISRNTSDSEIKKTRDKNLKRSGIILKNMEIIDAMEQDIDGDARFLPVKLNRDGALAATSSVCTTIQMGILSKHINDVLYSMGCELCAGNVSANPYVKKQVDSCEYCKYMPACQYDPSNGDLEKRYLFSMKPEKFWNKMGGELIGDELD